MKYVAMVIALGVWVVPSHSRFIGSFTGGGAAMIASQNYHIIHNSRNYSRGYAAPMPRSKGAWGYPPEGMEHLLKPNPKRMLWYGCWGVTHKGFVAGTAAYDAVGGGWNFLDADGNPRFSQASYWSNGQSKYDPSMVACFHTKTEAVKYVRSKYKDE